MRSPIAGAELFNAVMDAADWRCQCEGACGRTHIPGGMCRESHGHGTRLVIAPKQPTGTTADAEVRDVEHLRAWCPRCVAGVSAAARAAALEEQSEEPPSLF
ncbi:hypothetical protein [Streptomyces sp. NPDC002994]|uniref:hypothetical protein n=1 Tax=Streptomyces sp. NPDC002994 TaxID=3154441 RepID=UPI0033B5206F